MTTLISQAKLIFKRFTKGCKDPEIAIVDGFTFKFDRINTFKIGICKIPELWMTESRNISLYFDYPKGYKVLASFSYTDDDGKERMFPGPAGVVVNRIRTNEGYVLSNGGHFDTPIFPKPHPTRAVQVCRK